MSLVEQVAPTAVLVTAGQEGKDVAARVAVRLDSGILTDAIDVRLVDGTVQATQSVFSGSWLATRAGRARDADHRRTPQRRVGRAGAGDPARSTRWR